MKQLKPILAVFFLLMGYPVLSQPESIYALVSGDTVTLWHTAAWRNCGALYKMDIEEQDHLVTWYQADTGDAAFCLCYFDMSVTFRVTEPGNYDVDVYYSESLFPGEFIYAGSTSFYIGNAPGREQIISQYQSDCYPVGIEEPGNLIMRLYPNPVRRDQDLTLEFSSYTVEPFLLEFYTVTGKQIYSRVYSGNSAISDSWPASTLFPKPGVYFMKLNIGDKIYAGKVIVLK